MQRIYIKRGKIMKRDRQAVIKQMISRDKIHAASQNWDSMN